MKKYTTVEEFRAKLTPKRRAEVDKLRQLITSHFPDLIEHVKWNSSSYIFNGEDRLTFNMHYPDRTMLILHMGATRKEDKKGEPILKGATDLLVWNSDIRGTLSFTSIDDIEAKQERFIQLIHDWLTLK